MGMFSESVDVVCAPGGQPAELRWGGTDYLVCAEPVRWYERRQWWAEERRAPLGSGPGLVDHEIWRVQVLPAGRNPHPETPAAEPSAEPLTLDLVRHAGSGRWRLIRIHDALRPQDTIRPKSA
ncbi:hypothetical protein [Arthrobacter sp. NPDC056727]|uniref:hypothetical protein n=1 Tax=Arthrobacter sp. NPDC056727 TaxID=3345927 RepID=UPI00366DDABB